MTSIERVFVIGMFKTGTTSVVSALQQLGYVPGEVEGMTNFADENSEKAGKKYTTVTYLDIPGIDPIDPTHIHKTIRSGPHLPQIVNAASRGTVFADAPWLYLYREWDELFPSNSRYVLTLRHGGASAAAASDLAMWDRLGLYTEVRAALGDEEVLQRLAFRYDLHNRAVRNYFAGRDCLLQICLGENSSEENWRLLTNFVRGQNSHIPNVPFPRENVNPNRTECVEGR